MQNGQRQSSLTAREREVAMLLLAGRSNSQIARELVIERATVRSHIKRLYHKLGARSRQDAVAILKERE